MNLRASTREKKRYNISQGEQLVDGILTSFKHRKFRKAQSRYGLPISKNQVSPKKKAIIKRKPQNIHAIASSKIARANVSQQPHPKQETTNEGNLLPEEQIQNQKHLFGERASPQLIFVSPQNFLGKNNRSYFKCKIEDFWIIKSQFVGEGERINE